MELTQKVVKLMIGGEEYTLRGDSDNKKIIQVADYVNQKISEISQKTPHQSTSRITVLAALNIAEELFQERNEKDRKLQEYESQANQLLEWLDHKLAEVTV